MSRETPQGYYEMVRHGDHAAIAERLYRAEAQVAQLQTTISQLEARTTRWRCVIANAEALQTAWHKYRELFGEDPHGTLPQLKAMLEFVHAEEKP